MTKNYFLRVLLLGVSIFAFGKQVVYFVGNVVSKLLQMLDVPHVAVTAVETVIHIGLYIVIAMASYFMLNGIYRKPEKVSRVSTVIIISFIVVSLFNNGWRIYTYHSDGIGSSFSYWRISSLVIDIVLAAGLLIMVQALRNGGKSERATYGRNTSSRVKYPIPPDLPN